MSPGGPREVLYYYPLIYLGDGPPTQVTYVPFQLWSLLFSYRCRYVEDPQRFDYLKSKSTWHLNYETS